MQRPGRPRARPGQARRLGPLVQHKQPDAAPARQTKQKGCIARCSPCNILARPEGIEPSTKSLEGSCSIRLSYERTPIPLGIAKAPARQVPVRPRRGRRVDSGILHSLRPGENAGRHRPGHGVRPFAKGLSKARPFRPGAAGPVRPGHRGQPGRQGPAPARGRTAV